MQVDGLAWVFALKLKYSRTINHIKNESVWHEHSTTVQVMSLNRQAENFTSWNSHEHLYAWEFYPVYLKRVILHLQVLCMQASTCIWAVPYINNGYTIYLTISFILTFALLVKRATQSVWPSKAAWWSGVHCNCIIEYIIMPSIINVCVYYAL